MKFWAYENNFKKWIKMNSSMKVEHDDDNDDSLATREL